MKNFIALILVGLASSSVIAECNVQNSISLGILEEMSSVSSCESKYYQVQGLHNEGAELNNSAISLVDEAYEKSPEKRCHLLKQSQKLLLQAEKKFEACKSKVAEGILACTGGTENSNSIIEMGEECLSNTESIKEMVPVLKQEITKYCN